METQEGQVAWAAGLFEGEGCISRTNKDAVRLDLALKSRDRDVLEKLLAVTERGKLYGPYKNDMIFWIVYGREQSVSILLDFWPYLGARRKAKAVELFPRLSELNA